MKFPLGSLVIVWDKNSKILTYLKSSNGPWAVISVETRINSMAAFKETINTGLIQPCCKCWNFNCRSQTSGDRLVINTQKKKNKNPFTKKKNIYAITSTL